MTIEYIDTKTAGVMKTLGLLGGAGAGLAAMGGDVGAGIDQMTDKAVDTVFAEHGHPAIPDGLEKILNPEVQQRADMIGSGLKASLPIAGGLAGLGVGSMLTPRQPSTEEIVQEALRKHQLQGQPA